MHYKGKMLLEIPGEAGRDLMKAVKATGKFIKDAIMTEVVPGELKSKLKNYNPPEGYIKAVRPFLKIYGGFFLSGSASILLSKNADLSTAFLRANPFYLYGLGDGCYDVLNFGRSESSLPPATLAIEIPYSFMSEIFRKTKTKTTL